jgi:signal transduction histidine kinase
MKFGIDSFQWKPAAVSWIGFLVVSIIVAGVGLVGSRYVTGFLQEQFILHGVEHNQDVAYRMYSVLRELLASGLSTDEALTRFQAITSEAEHFGMSIFLVEMPSQRVVIHSDPRIAADKPRLTELIQPPIYRHDELSTEADPWQGGIAATSSEQIPALFYLLPLGNDMPGAVRGWVLAVQTDIADLLTSVDRFRGHMNLILLGTSTLIASLGFIALRRVGRFYERFLERRLNERTEELRTAHAQLLQKATLAAIGQTASTLAHEMRNPLAAIKLALSGLFSAGYLQERERRRVELVLREVDRLDELLSQTLDYVRPVKLSSKPLLLDPLVDDVLDLVDPLLKEHNLQVQRTPCPQCPGVRLDVNQMQQALLNLFKNAIEASPTGGQITLSVRQQADRLVLEMLNAGPPIAADDLKRVFDPFFTTKPKGSGLGLALVKRVLDEHQGDVVIESSAESGIRTTLSLPISA